MALSSNVENFPFHFQGMVQGWQWIKYLIYHLQRNKLDSDITIIWGQKLQKELYRTGAPTWKKKIKEKGISEKKTTKSKAQKEPWIGKHQL